MSDDRFTAHLPGHTGRVLMAAFLDGPDHLPSAAADGTVRLWSSTEQRQLAEVRADASLHCAAYDQTTGHVVVGSAARHRRLLHPPPLSHAKEARTP
ncbi:hypothetical protein [Streptomyces sp. NPDC053726]|uniref:hypothetical protein n=1 Tax=Streptomyces sp. NPDC053726 TaxID=3365713 RepID=UPI0037D6C981